MQCTLQLHCIAWSAHKVLVIKIHCRYTVQGLQVYCRYTAHCSVAGYPSQQHTAGTQWTQRKYSCSVPCTCIYTAFNLQCIGSLPYKVPTIYMEGALRPYFPYNKPVRSGICSKWTKYAYSFVIHCVVTELGMGVTCSSSYILWRAKPIWCIHFVLSFVCFLLSFVHALGRWFPPETLFPWYATIYPESGNLRYFRHF